MFDIWDTLQGFPWKASKLARPGRAPLSKNPLPLVFGVNYFLCLFLPFSLWAIYLVDDGRSIALSNPVASPRPLLILSWDK